MNLCNFGVKNKHYNNSNQTCNKVLLENTMIYNLFIHKPGNIISIKIMQYSISIFFQKTIFLGYYLFRARPLASASVKTAGRLEIVGHSSTLASGIFIFSK